MSKSTVVSSLVILLALSSSAFAENWETKEELVHAASHNLDIDLTDKTVLCSQADYGVPFLKVLIPALAHITLLNHQNTGAGAPCVAAGECQAPPLGAGGPETILDPNNPKENVTVKVEALRVNYLEHDAMTCETYLVERIHVTIRGKDFFHEESAALGPRPYGDCL